MPAQPSVRILYPVLSPKEVLTGRRQHHRHHHQLPFLACGISCCYLLVLNSSSFPFLQPTVVTVRAEIHHPKTKHEGERMRRSLRPSNKQIAAQLASNREQLKLAEQIEIIEQQEFQEEGEKEQEGKDEEEGEEEVRDLSLRLIRASSVIFSCIRNISLFVSFKQFFASFIAADCCYSAS